MMENNETLFIGDQVDGWLMNRKDTESEKKMLKDDDTHPLNKLPIEYICTSFFFSDLGETLGFLWRAAMSDSPRHLAYERATPGILRVGM